MVKSGRGSKNLPPQNPISVGAICGDYAANTWPVAAMHVGHRPGL